MCTTIGTLLDGLLERTCSKVDRYHLPPFAINPFEDSILEQISFGRRLYSANLSGQVRHPLRQSEVGRWTQQDPVAGSLADAQGLNHYLFVEDNPVNKTDPSGEQVLSSS